MGYDLQPLGWMKSVSKAKSNELLTGCGRTLADRVQLDRMSRVTFEVLLFFGLLAPSFCCHFFSFCSLIFSDPPLILCFSRLFSSVFSFFFEVVFCHRWVLRVAWKPMEDVGTSELKEPHVARHAVLRTAGNT